MDEIHLSLNLSDNELDAIKRAVEKLFKDAQYFNRYSDELLAKKLIKKIAEAEQRDRSMNDLFTGLSDEEEII